MPPVVEIFWLLGGAELIDVAEKLLYPAAYLVPLRPERLDLFGEFCVDVLGFLECLLRRREFLQCGFLLLTETGDECHRLLDALFEVSQRIDFGFLSGSSHGVVVSLCKLLPGRIESRFDLRRDQRELSGIGGCRLRKHLPVQFKASQLQSMHEFAVGETRFARRSTDTDDPQRTEIAFLTLTARIGELQRALNSLLSGTV